MDKSPVKAPRGAFAPYVSSTPLNNTNNLLSNSTSFQLSPFTPSNNTTQNILSSLSPLEDNNNNISNYQYNRSDVHILSPFSTNQRSNMQPRDNNNNNNNNNNSTNIRKRRTLETQVSSSSCGLFFFSIIITTN